MRDYYQQTRIYASKKARLTRSLRQTNNGSVLVVRVLHDDVVPHLTRDTDNKDDFSPGQDLVQLEVLTSGDSQGKGASWNESS